MLKTMRSGVKGIMAWVVVGLFILAFAFVGVPALNTLGSSDAVSVGNQGFSITRVEREFTRRVNRQQAATGALVTPQDAIEQGLLRDTLSYFVSRGLFEEERKTLGVAVTDKMVQQHTRRRPEFLDDSDEFDQALFQRLLADNGFTLQSYDDLARAELTELQITQAAAIGIPAPKIMTDLLVLRQSEERLAQTAILTVAEAPSPEDEDLRSFYAENAARYEQPARRSYAVVTLSRATLSDRLSVDPEDVEQLFRAREARLGTPERRTFSQAQFPTLEDAAAAKARIIAGETFQEVTEQAGVATVSFTDEVKTNLADRNLADAVFGEENIGLVGPIDSVFGAVLAEVTKIDAGTAVTFDDVKEDLETELFEESYRVEIGELYNQLQEAGDGGSSLADAAADLELSVRTVGPVDRALTTASGAIEQDVPMPVHALAFEREVGSLFEVVDLPEGEYAFVELVSVTPSATQPFDKVADQVLADYQAMTKVQRLAAAARDFRERVQAGETFDAVAADLGVEVTAHTITISQPPEDLPLPLLEALFKNDIGDVASGAVDGTEAIMVGQVDEVTFGPNGQASLFSEQLRFQLGQQIGQEHYAAYVDSLQSAHGVKQDERLIASRFAEEQ